MKLNIGWMYHDIMNLYGDKGNIMVLQKRCKDRGIDTDLRYCDIGDSVDLSDLDIVFFGGGADREQAALMQDLRDRKENIAKALQQGTVFLLICGGYQLFGEYYVDANGKQIDGLGFFDYYTISGKKEERCVGNIAIETQLDDQTVILSGFENHGGQTFGVKTPFGHVFHGFGNHAKGQSEGFMNDQVIGTYLHGPLLPRNPELADYLIKKGLKRNYGDVELSPLDDAMEHMARDIMLTRMQIRKNEKN